MLRKDLFLRTEEDLKVEIETRLRFDWHCREFPALNFICHVFDLVIRLGCVYDFLA